MLCGRLNSRRLGDIREGRCAYGVLYNSVACCSGLDAGEACSEWQTWSQHFNVKSMFASSFLQAFVYVSLAVSAHPEPHSTVPLCHNRLRLPEHPHTLLRVTPHSAFTYFICDHHPSSRPILAPFIQEVSPPTPLGFPVLRFPPSPVPEIKAVS